jgi:hypothetical protein
MGKVRKCEQVNFRESLWHFVITAAKKLNSSTMDLAQSQSIGRVLAVVVTAVVVATHRFV